MQPEVESVPEGMLRQPGAFGPAHPASENSTPTVRLLAHLGRSLKVVDPEVIAERR
jgi:hypothetical protein